MVSFDNSILCDLLVDREGVRCVYVDGGCTVRIQKRLLLRHKNGNGKIESPQRIITFTDIDRFGVEDTN